MVLLLVPERAATLRERLRGGGHRTLGQLRILDASALLEEFIFDGAPDPHMFAALV